MSNKRNDIKSEKITEDKRIIEKSIKEVNNMVEKKSHQEILNDTLKSNDAELVREVNVLNERVMNLEVSLTATSKVLNDKDIASQDEINKAIEKEQQRLQAFQQIQQIQGNYRIRLEMCKKWDIKVDTTSIVVQLKEDKSVSEKEKLEIAAEYGIDVRFFLQKSN